MTQKQLSQKKLRPDELLLITLLDKKEKELFNELMKDIYYVQALLKLNKKGYIESSKAINMSIVYDNIQLLQKASIQPKKVNTIASLKPQVTEWIHEYRDLFPKGMNSNGYPFKGDKKGCINNMAKLLYNYPEFNDKDIILKATKCYLETKKKDNYAYTAMADRFIWKNDMSTLASYCEQLKEGTLKNEKRNIINL